MKQSQGFLFIAVIPSRFCQLGKENSIFIDAYFLAYHFLRASSIASIVGPHKTLFTINLPTKTDYI